MRIRKVGGIYWVSIGRLRISLCVKRKEPTIKEQTDHVIVQLMDDRVIRLFSTYVQ